MKKIKYPVLILALAWILTAAIPAWALEAPSLALQSGLSVKSDVVRARSLKLSPTKAVLYVGTDGVGDGIRLAATVTPEEAQGQLIWSSSKNSVASVDQFGNVIPHKTGTAVITCRTGDGSKLKRTSKITVKPQPPQAVSILQGDALMLTQGRQVQLEAQVLPANAVNKKVTWKSSKTSVAKVSSSGVVTAVKPGTAVITCKTQSGGLTDRITIEVGYEDTDIYYLAIGQAEYDSVSHLPSSLDDVERFTRTLTACSFGQKSLQGNTYRNLTGAQLRQVLNGLPTMGMDENDVTYLYYTGHGMNLNREYRGALIGRDYNSSNYRTTLVTVDEVREYLDKVPGKVVVVMDCCYSGQYITPKGLEQKALSQQELEETADQVIRAFQTAGSAQGKGLESLVSNNDLRNKYKILVACKSMELSWAVRADDNNYSLFTRYICEAAGMTGAETGDFILSGSLPADTNKDGRVSVSEIKKYASARIQKHAKRLNVSQTMVTWPSSDTFAIFGRTA